MTIHLRNHSARKFTDISSELWREYRWSTAARLTIENPQWLSVSKSGHYIVDDCNICHFIPYGWYRLTWEPRNSAPHFVI